MELIKALYRFLLSHLLFLFVKFRIVLIKKKNKDSVLLVQKLIVQEPDLVHLYIRQLDYQLIYSKKKEEKILASLYGTDYIQYIKLFSKV